MEMIVEYLPIYIYECIYIYFSDFPYSRTVMIYVMSIDTNGNMMIDT